MSLHKLTAGSGYDYLTRQVAALDATDKGHTGLASYYTERDKSPGVWIGSGLDGIDGLAAGEWVTAAQMRALFGCGLHPLAELRQQQLEGPDLTERDYQDAARLGAPFKIVDGDISPFRLEVARRFAAIQTAAGLPAGAPLPAANRARVRTEVAREFFLSEHGREPVDARELAGQTAKDSRPRTKQVAGFDLTFSPVKSVSTLWAVAEPAVAAAIERAHQAAVNDATSSERAKMLGVVSVIRRNPDETWHGDMLDGLAFVKAQKDHGAEPKGARVLLVGAGGAGSAITIALLEAGVRELVIHDADESRVATLLKLLEDLGQGRASAGPPDPTGCDLVCNASPMGMEDDDPLPVDAALLTSSMFVGDVIAGHGVTPFLQAARAAGCKTANGDHMVEAAQDLMVDFMLQ